MARAWPAREILAAAERLPSARPPALALGLAVLSVQAEVEAIDLPPAVVGDASARIGAGRAALSESWTPSHQWPDRFAELATRIERALEPAETWRDAAADTRRAFAIHEAARAFYRPAAIQLVAAIDDARWLGGECPTCGGMPDLASITEGGERRLLCGRCDTDWGYRRIGCPFCGTDDHEHLGYHPAGDGSYRLYVCTACSRYLKAVDMRRRRDACAPLERWLTQGLDVAAVAAGYTGG